MGVKSALKHFTISNILYYGFSVFITYKTMSFILLKTMFKSTVLYQRKSLSTELVNSNNFKIWRKSVQNSAQSNPQKVLKFMVSRIHPMTLNHISCPLICSESSNPSSSYGFKVRGEYDSTIDEIEFYDSEEMIKFITDQPFLKEDISNMFKKYIQNQMSSLQLSKGLYHFQLNLTKDHSLGNEGEEYDLIEVLTEFNTVPNFESNII